MISFNPQRGSCDAGHQLGVETRSCAQAGVRPALKSGTLAPCPAPFKCGTSASSVRICKWVTMPGLLNSQVLSNRQDNACESGASTKRLREQSLKSLLSENVSFSESSDCTLRTWRFRTLLISKRAIK